MGSYNPNLLQADELSATYNGEVIVGKTMNDLIPTLGKAEKYVGQFVVVDGKLVYQGRDTNRQVWSTNAGIKVEPLGEPKITIIPPVKTLVVPGTDIIYSIKFSSNAALTTIDLTNKVEVLDNNGVALVTQPVINIGTISGTTADVIRQVDITIKTDSLIDGAYKIKIKAGAVTNADNISNSIDAVSSIGFDIDSTPPTNPLMSVNTTEWTNSNVITTIIYSTDSVVKEYSFDSTTWNVYTVPVVITTNNTTIYAKGKDASGNESGLSTITVSNIDKNVPTITYGTNGGSLETISTTVTVSDIESGVNTSTLQYVWGTQNTTEPTSGWTTFINGAVVTKSADSGTYYLWIKAVDNTGNNVTVKSNMFTIHIPINQSFNYTGDYQTFTVPYTGTYKLEVWGAQGSGSYSGRGGYAYGNIDLTQGQILYIYLGGQNGYNGGGSGSVSGPGGGATDIRLGGTALTNRIIVAGGGGSGYYFNGGAGGGTTGNGGGYHDGGMAYGGTQTNGGNGPIGGSAGSLGQGGSGYYGAGGGGYYGGGGGGGFRVGADGAGGGGSGYIGTLSNANMSTGVNSGNGRVKITY